MAKCKYYLNIDGKSVVLDGDFELTDYIKNNIISDGVNVKHNIKHSAVITNDQQKSLDIFSKIINAFDPDSSNAYKFLSEEHLIRGKSQLLVPLFIRENYARHLAEKLTAENPE
jgi:hypothetical protein